MDTVTYSDAQGGADGTGNIAVDPLFTAPITTTMVPTTTGDYHLQPGSPAINAGDSLSVTVGTDLAGNPRIIGSAVNCHLMVMNAVATGFRDSEFDCVYCVQNGISAFHVDQRLLMREAVRITRRGGLVLFSSYSEKFWDERLAWFREQARMDLIGEIDEEATGNGVIMCKDGFQATTVSADAFFELASSLNVVAEIVEVDESSVFCVMRVE